MSEKMKTSIIIIQFIAIIALLVKRKNTLNRYTVTAWSENGHRKEETIYAFTSREAGTMFQQIHPNFKWRQMNIHKE